jgi:hypothetical protein
MPSVSGLLEQRELTARRRVEELREEADRVQAGQGWKEWVIACSRVGEVLALGGDGVDAPDATGGIRETDPQPEPAKAAAKPKSVVPMWRVGLA